MAMRRLASGASPLPPRAASPRGKDLEDERRVGRDEGGRPRALWGLGSARGQATVGGQCPLASHAEPINQFEFYRPFIQGLGYHYPSSLWIPLPLVRLGAQAMEVRRWWSGGAA